MSVNVEKWQSVFLRTQDAALKCHLYQSDSLYGHLYYVLIIGIYEIKDDK